MANILDEIVAYKHTEVAQQKNRVPVEQLKAAIRSLPECRNFCEAVTQSNPRGVNVIAEVKKASPSAGLIRSDFDPVWIAETYAACGADAISVLTDEKYFQGRLEYLTAVKKAVSLPVMRKEFIVDPYQLYEARAAGADAVLLIADALAVAELKDLMTLAADLGLSILLEVHDKEILMSVRHLIGFPEAGTTVLGINNQNLSTMEVDLDTTGRLASLLDAPKGLVAESGIKTPEHVERLKQSGATAVLIGQTLCEHTNIAEQFKRLFG
ncbi:MAG: indole-3-glycerol phosphate synthase TrpC [Planctomycetes bacterium]|nr:indole-3-glycerol phosphate synthase TrpC [Planctomycetota bacterium]